MNCSRCGRQLTEGQAYTFQGKPICDDCLMDVGLSPHGCDPWATYTDTADRKRHGLTGTAGLTETEAKVYEFIKTRSRATRQEVVDGLGLSEKELEAQLTALMHTELVKEGSEGGRQYLIATG